MYTEIIKYNNPLIKAEIVADSINKQGDRLTTFVCTFPRIILSEFNTHRLFSRNSASSRAIPFKKMMAKILDEPFIPSGWMAEHKGMQGTKYIIDKKEIKKLRDNWLAGRDAAVAAATALHNLGLTKQICNRITEPYMMHTVIVTASDWENFFALRAHDEAEIHIGELAFKMLDVYNDSQPVQLQAGEWHVPFGGQFRKNEINLLAQNKACSVVDIEIKIATARCARISYFNFTGKDDYEKDLSLYDRLASSGHFSPFEHCAQAMSYKEYEEMVKWDKGKIHKGWYGNIKGFIQLRKLFKNENHKEPRIKR